ncbi:hypothetical protein CCR75_002315 [Bremia lactucae]|uniref:Uncharacterized protein n=1 Tax=Bremia lactucae TaxID=4779 RepID=A0A976FI20_BRELC|nr:hypothetical protein CCR75_002315 [Bremia lactucae]
MREELGTHLSIDSLGANTTPLRPLQIKFSKLDSALIKAGLSVRGKAKKGLGNERQRQSMAIRQAHGHLEPFLGYKNITEKAKEMRKLMSPY